MNFIAQLIGGGTRSSRLPTSLPPNSFLVETDGALLNKIDSVTEGKFDLEAISPTVFKTIFACSSDGKQGIKDCKLLPHQFLALANIAFDKHYGFVLNPSHLFLLITQQIALHVNQNSEALRAQFVNHEGKKDLKLEVPAIPSREEWAGIIQSFQEQIAANTVPDTKDLMTLQDFESAGFAEKVAGDVVLMDMCQAFFTYTMFTKCGIPYFILEGSESDWELLRTKAEQAIGRKTLPEFSAFWLQALLPTLDKLVRARKGEIDHSFWRNFYKRGSIRGSGGYTYVNGWVNVFFPVTDKNKQNKFCRPYDSSFFGSLTGGREDGLNVSSFTAGVASAPVIWDRLGETIPMSFCAGFIGGTVVHETALRSEVAWWVGPIDEEADRVKREKKSRW